MGGPTFEEAGLSPWRLLSLDGDALASAAAEALKRLYGARGCAVKIGERLRGHSGAPLPEPCRVERFVGGEIHHDGEAAPSSLEDEARIRAVLGRLASTARAEEAQERLRRSEQRFALAVESVDDGLFDWRVGFGVEGNDRLFTMLGYRPGTISRMREWNDLCHPEDLPRVRAEFQAHLDGKTPSYRTELRLRCADGSYKWVLDRGRVIERDEGGRPLRMTGFHTDISERKRLEANVLGSERLAALGTLAAALAHEVNTPLAYLSAALDGMVNATDPKHAQAALAVAREGAADLREVVRDVLVFARAETDEQAAVEVAEVAARAVRLTRRKIEHRGQVLLELSPLPTVRGNPGRLLRVFVNLLDNAADAIGRGGKVVFSAWTAPDGGALIRIRDDGPGIPPELRARIFEPFFTTKAPGEGTGLGLAVCAKVVGELGGRISLDSEAGKGAAFTVWLPPSRAVTSPATEPLSPVRRGRVLVVDDHRAMGQSLKLLLARAHDVDAVPSAEEARAKLSTAAYDLILCDLSMPKESGMALYEGLLASAPDLAAKFAFMTGGAVTPEGERFLRSVKNPVLKKPFDPGELERLVAESLVGS